MTTNDDEVGPREVAPADPLIWHYERERRMKLDGSLQWTHTVDNKTPGISFSIRSNFSLAANACFIDVLIPSTMPVELLSSIFQFVEQNAEKYATVGPFEMRLPIREEGFLAFDRFPEHRMSTRDCKFTGRVFVYTAYLLTDRDKASFVERFKSEGLSLIIRDSAWINEIQRFIDRPVVFLGHDSADKADLVRLLAHRIDGKEIRVWYDELSLRPGDRLRKSLDAGLEEADYFMPVVTENWMKNERYAEYEFDAIMHKYVTEKSVTIIPICVGVSPTRLKEKSRVLADIVAIVHGPDETVENLAHKIANAVDPRIPSIGKPLPPLAPAGKEGLFSVGISVGPAEKGSG